MGKGKRRSRRRSGIPDNREDVLKKDELDKGKPGDDLCKSLKSVAAALPERLFEAFGKPFQIILTEALFDKECSLHCEACEKEWKI